jgi:hypothetical protein
MTDMNDPGQSDVHGAVDPAYGSAVCGSVEIIQQLTRIGADGDAYRKALEECKKLLADSPCKGPSCNACDVTYIRRYDSGGTPLSLEFKLAVARPCSTCCKGRSSEPTIYRSSGDGIPQNSKVEIPQIGVIPPIYSYKEKCLFSWLFGERKVYFGLESECYDM